MILSQLVLNHLVFNEPYMRKCLPHLRADFFETIGEKHVFGLIDDFINEFGVCPTPEVLAVKLERSKLAEGVYNSSLEVVTSLEPGLENLDWLIKESENWARDRGLANAVRRAARVYSGEDTIGPDQLPDIFNEALNIRFSEDMGHVYWEAAGQHYDDMHSEATKIPFSVEILNLATRGGVEPKTLNIVLAGINVGKSTFLIDRACEQVEMGKNVVYFTLEVEERKIRHRSDVRLLGYNFDRVEKMTKDEFLGHVNKKRRSTDGHYFIKEFPSGAAHIGHMRHYIKEVERKYDMKIDMILVDYLTEMCSSRLPLHMMGNTNTYYGSIARELRTLAFEFECPVWTAMQFTRDKQDGMDAKMSDTADAISIPKIADFMISVGQDEADGLLKQAYVTQMKSRYADKNKMRNFRIGLDNDLQKYFDLGYDQQKDIMGDSQYEEFKKSAKMERSPTLDESDSVLNWNFSS